MEMPPDPGTLSYWCGFLKTNKQQRSKQPNNRPHLASVLPSETDYVISKGQVRAPSLREGVMRVGAGEGGGTRKVLLLSFPCVFLEEKPLCFVYTYTHRNHPTIRISRTVGKKT